MTLGLWFVQSTIVRQKTQFKETCCRAARESDFPGFREVGKLESISRPVSSGIGKFVNKFFYPTSKRHTVTSPPPFMGSAQLFLF